jgi:hypothetical protein
VAYMLSMEAVKLRHPVASFILHESDDVALHSRSVRIA